MKVKSVFRPTFLDRCYIRLQLVDKQKTAPLQLYFHANVQVTFKVWRRANFVTFFFPNKKA